MLELITVTIFMLLAAMAPGADFALVVRNSLLYSRRSACFTALGVGAGQSIHTTYSVLGLTVLISKSLLLFTIVKYVGAAYLCYLGIRSLMAGGGPHATEIKPAEKDISAFAAFKQGLICNTLNPKAPLIYIAFYSAVLPPDISQLGKILYGLEFIFIVGGWFVFLACIITHPTVKKVLGRVQRVLTKALGGMMLYFGIRLAFIEQ